MTITPMKKRLAAPISLPPVVVTTMMMMMMMTLLLLVPTSCGFVAAPLAGRSTQWMADTITTTSTRAVTTTTLFLFNNNNKKSKSTPPTPPSSSNKSNNKSTTTTTTTSTRTNADALQKALRILVTGSPDGIAMIGKPQQNWLTNTKEYTASKGPKQLNNIMLGGILGGSSKQNTNADPKTNDKTKNNKQRK